MDKDLEVLVVEKGFLLGEGNRLTLNITEGTKRPLPTLEEENKRRSANAQIQGFQTGKIVSLGDVPSSLKGNKTKPTIHALLQTDDYMNLTVLVELLLSYKKGVITYKELHLGLVSKYGVEKTSDYLKDVEVQAILNHYQVNNAFKDSDTIAFDTETVGGLFDTQNIRITGKQGDGASYITEAMVGVYLEGMKAEVKKGEPTEEKVGRIVVGGIQGKPSFMQNFTGLLEKAILEPQGATTEENGTKEAEAEKRHIERLKEILAKWEIVITVLDTDGVYTSDVVYKTGYLGLIFKFMQTMENEEVQENFVLDALSKVAGRDFREEHKGRRGKRFITGYEESDKNEEYKGLVEHFFPYAGKTRLMNKALIIWELGNKYQDIDTHESRRKNGVVTSCFLLNDMHLHEAEMIKVQTLEEPKEKKHFAEGLFKRGRHSGNRGRKKR